MKTKNEIDSKKYPFLCCDLQTEVLIWDFYGYWHGSESKTFPRPIWANDDARKMVDFLLEHLNPPNLQIKIETHTGERINGKSWHASWVLFDLNNPHIAQYGGAVGGCASENGAKNYALKRYGELKHLYDGDIHALLTYKKTGIPCLPDWNKNESDSWGWINGNKNRVLRASEAEKAITMQSWKNSNKSFSDFAVIGDLVSPDIVDYFISALPPVTWNNELIQMGEPYNFNESGNLTYLTLEKKGVLWYYVGPKPKAK
jgi:hypothetical protein